MSPTDRPAMSHSQRQTEYSVRNGDSAPRFPPCPEEPDLDDCCGSGCDPCVFDIYEQRLERWRARCATIRKAHGLPPAEEPPC